MKVVQAWDGADRGAHVGARTRFAVLGPVRVSCGGRTAQIKGTRPQALLTALLLEANRVVTLARLSELIWEAPPPSATANLRTYASRLRGALVAASGRADPQRLVATAAGYRLRVSPEESDIAAFTERARLGIEALRQDPDRAATCLRSALSLWRGAVAENVPRTAGLAARLVALEDQRHRATECLMQARLALGEHEALVGELRELVAAHPTRERLWCHLILANYRCGDPAAAITAFEHAREVLRRELAIVPGAEMTDLYHRVLRRDPLLHAAIAREHVSALCRSPRTQAANPGSGAPDRSRLPLEPPEPSQQSRGPSGPGHPGLLRLPEPFVGRADELAHLVQRLTSSAERRRLALISGPAGVGKSALAARVAQALRGLGHGRCVTLDLGGTAMDRAPLTVVQALRRLRELRNEVPPSDPASASPESPVFVLDNAATAAQVSPLIAALEPCHVIVTSRPVLTMPGAAARLDLAPLPASESRQLLSALCGAERAAAEPDRIDLLARICCGLPLALHIAGSRLSARPEWSIATFADILADERCRLDELRGDGLAVRSSFAVSYRAVAGGGTAADERAARLFRRLGRQRAGSVDTEQATEILECDRVLATAAVGRLADARLVEPAGAGGYRIADLMRIFAAEQRDH